MTQFPKDFYWGASTASHQVEGGTNTQWDRWELARTGTDARIVRSLLKNSPAWPEQQKRADQPETYISGRAVEHYSRYREDFAIIQQLNMNAFRFSIEWARIEPREGEWDSSEIAHYREYLQQLRGRGIEPFVNLWHFTNPIWFEDRGGFTKKANVKLFIRYVDKIMAELGDLMSFIIPLNEPNTYTLISYLLGWWPPQKHNPFTSVRVYKNMIAAHRSAYATIKARRPESKVGSAMAISKEIAASVSPIAKISTPVWNYIWNHWFLDACKGTQDFVGVNFYMTNYHGWYGGWNNPAKPKNDLSWYMEPKAIGEVLTETYKRYKLPLYVTENGLADADDTRRQWWIKETIDAMEDSLAKGVDLRGYLHWSLLDNFEWAFGWLAEFGLVHVDRDTMKRTIRPSAKWYGEQIAKYRKL